ncbi:CcdC family protein [Actinomycetes bacterium NPDC127524]
MLYISSGFAIFMAIMVLVIRVKAAKKPTNIRKIILPPIFMSTGALMYLVPEFRLTKNEILEAVVFGVLFSFLLIRTSNFEVRADQIYLQRSKAFIFILGGLVVVRIIAKLVLSYSIDVGQLSGMFFLLAYSMIVPWRIAMFLQYRKVKNKHMLKPKIL